MIEIGGRPILWHIMKAYSQQGVNEFVVCLGYKGYVIKEYFSNYFLHMADVTFDIAGNSMEVHQQQAEPWKVTLVETGDHTQTGGRLRRVREHVEKESEFFFTYGDGVANIDISAQLAFHRNHGKKATIAAVRPPGRYGALNLDEAKVTGFQEKPDGDGGFINGGFFVLSPTAIDYIAGDSTSWESEPLESLAADDELRAWKHFGFWQPMDTLREKMYLEKMWESGAAPWKVW